MKQTWMRLWPLLTTLVAVLPLGPVKAQQLVPVPLEARLSAEQNRLDRLEMILCSERSSEVCKAIDDEQTAIKELRGEIDEFEERRGSLSDKNQIERGLAKVRDEIAALERAGLREGVPALAE